MLKTIFKIGAISLQLVKFDTQDNLVKTCEATEWSQNVNLDTFQPLQTYGLWRYAPTKIWFKSKTPVKAWKTMSYNGRKIGEVGDFGDEIINRSLSTPILPILCYMRCLIIGF